MAFLLTLLIWIVVGYFLGAAKNRAGMGMLLGGVLGPIGWLIMFCLSKRPPGQPVAGVLPTSTSPVPTASTGLLPPTPPTAAESHFHVAQNGQDLGPMTVRRIRQLLAAGQLTGTDTYFDPQLNAWVALSRLPE